MTAVEYAEELINVILYYIDEEDKQRINEVFNDAKKIEKQQIDETCSDWWNEGASYMYDGKRNYLSYEQYYNEKFKK